MKIRIDSITDANVFSMRDLKYILDHINDWHQVYSLKYSIKGYLKHIVIFANEDVHPDGIIIIKCSPFDPDMEYELKEDEAYAKD